jgi:hypothetical protein
VTFDVGFRVKGKGLGIGYRVRMKDLGIRV